jgi:GT2 family glycosyltransferase
VASDIAFDPRGNVSEPILRVEHYGKGLSHHIDDDDSVLDQVMAPVRGEKFLVTAALWKIRKSLFDEMGGLSVDYLFAYYEDADFCLRMLQAGHKVEIDETARWIHMEGVGKAKPPAVRSFMWLNRVLFSQRFANSGLVAPASTDLFQL